MAAAALGVAGTASATCASISGIGDGGGCTSAPTSFAVGIGPNTTASAIGFFSGAVANGATNGPLDFTDAETFGIFDLAYSGGPNTSASAVGNANHAFNQGSNAHVQAGFLPIDTLNSAVNLGGNNVNVWSAFGVGNLAANVSSNNSFVLAAGIGSSAFSIGSPNTLGPGNVVAAGTLNNATDVLGNGNGVAASSGPLAFATALGQTGKTITRTATGFNVNGTNFP
jgi:hypothetical protein